MPLFLFKSIFVIAITSLIFASVALAGALHDAVNGGNLQDVKSLLESDPAILDEPDENGRAPLHLAAAKGNLEILTYLCDRGANLEPATQSGFTPLFFALQKGNFDAAKILLEKGANINAESKYQTTPLFTAVEGGNEEIVKYLVEHGADINYTSPWFGSPLHRAIYMNSPAITAYLIERGARLDAVEQRQQTPLHQAALLGRIEEAEILVVNGAAINVLDIQNKTPLHLAVQYGTDRTGTNHSAELAALFISGGADINTVAADSTTPLIHAVRQGYTDIADLILKKGGDINSKDPTTSGTLLHVAAVKGFSDLADLLLARHIDRDAIDVDGKTALDYAREHGNRAVAGKLLKEKPKAETIKTGYDYLNGKMTNGESYVWYMNHRGWTVKTKNHLFVFDNEELGRRPDAPSLSNGWIDLAEIRKFDITALYSAYHAEPNSFEFIHRFEDSLPQIRFIQYADDRWRGGNKSVYIKGRQNQKFGNVEIIPYETHDAGGMGSLGYLVKADNVSFFYTNFIPEDFDSFKVEIDFLAAQAPAIDFAIVETTPGQENQYAEYIVTKLNPRVIIPYDRSGLVSYQMELATELKGKHPDLQTACAIYPGDRFHIAEGKVTD